MICPPITPVHHPAQLGTVLAAHGQECAGTVANSIACDSTGIAEYSRVRKFFRNASFALSLIIPQEADCDRSLQCP